MFLDCCSKLVPLPYFLFASTEVVVLKVLRSLSPDGFIVGEGEARETFTKDNGGGTSTMPMDRSLCIMKAVYNITDKVISQPLLLITITQLNRIIYQASSQHWRVREGMTSRHWAGMVTVQK